MSPGIPDACGEHLVTVGAYVYHRHPERWNVSGIVTDLDHDRGQTWVQGHDA